MKVRMKDNLILKYQLCPEFSYKNNCRISCPRNELMAIKEMSGLNDYFKAKQFLKSIEGKVVDLVFTAGDAFEKNDNNYWLPRSLWDPLPTNKQLGG